MTWWQALILGIVEGLTEFLPVSSTGHLLLAQRWMGMTQSVAADAYVVVIQIGAILAVLGLYWKRAKQMILGVAGRDEVGKRISINVIVAFVPAAVVGLLFNELIETYLFGLWPITFAWFVGGLAILGTVWWRKRRLASIEQLPASEQDGSPQGMSLEELTWKMALIIGLVQCLAMWPGTSRSLVTIVAGVMVGLRLIAAVEFSFILGVLTLSAASVYKMLQGGHAMLESYDVMSLTIGLVAAGVSAAIAVKWMVGYLNRHSLAIFGYYRIALAVMVVIMVMLQFIEAR